MMITRTKEDGTKEKIGVRKVGETRDGRWIVRNDRGDTYILNPTDTRRAIRDERKAT